MYRVSERIRLVLLSVCLLTIAMSLTFGPGAPSAAADQNAQPFAGYTKYIWYRTNYQINADGTDVETHDWGLKVLSEQGIGDADQASIEFSDILQDAQIISAYTLKKDGRRIDVPAANFQEDINKGKAGNSPMFSDFRTKTIAFPDVAVGDTVAMSYRIIQKEAMYPGNFSVIGLFSRFTGYDHAELSVSAPPSLPMYIYQRGIQGGELPRTADGRRRWLWTYRNEKVAVPESEEVSELDYGPMIVASTFKDYAAVAAAFSSRAQPKAAVTPRVKQLADQLTRNLHGMRAQAKALYDWVTVNIQYANNSAGIGSVVPHAADVVLANRMGDCKDHSILLQALLAARGIASTPVLVNSAPVYSLPPVASPEFDHMITYIPGLNLYADSTSRYTPFGSLPINDSDKPVIHTVNFSEIERTPPIEYTENQLRLATDLTIHPDGSADGVTRINETGVTADSLRAALNNLEPNREDLTLQHILQNNGFEGTGSLITSDRSTLAAAPEFGGRYNLPDAYVMPGPAALTVRSPFAGSASTIESFLVAANEPHTVNFQCYGSDRKEQYKIDLPKDVSVLAIPRDVAIDVKDMSYRATYKLSDNSVTVMRELQNRTPGNACTPNDAAAAREFAHSVRRDLRSQVLYR